MRGKEFLITALCLALFTGILFGIGITNAFIDQQTVGRVFPTLFWGGTFFIGILSIGRAYSYELTFQTRCAFQTQKNLLFPFIFSKILSTSIIILLSSITFAFVLSGLLGVQRFDFITLITILLPFSIAFSSLGILLTALTSTVIHSVTLFSLLMLPLLVPLFFACSELTYICFSEKKSSLSLVFSSPWWTLLVLMDVVYLFASASLYPTVIKE